MKQRSRWKAFLVGVFLAPCLFLIVRLFPEASRDATHYLGIAGAIAVLAVLPFIAVRLKKEAIPSKRSDMIGYAVILSFSVAIYFVARAMIR